MESNWISFYERSNQHLREEQLKRVFPNTHFKMKKTSTLVGFNKKENERRIEKYNKKNICIDCGLEIKKGVDHLCD